jgi:Xaa-Pro aminopeptidase
LTPPDVLTQETAQMIREAVPGNIVPMSDYMADLRYIKSDQELRMMRVAARLSTWGMDAMLRAIEPGVRELQVAACADYVMKCMGADRLGFTSIVMSGDRVTCNIGRATERIMRAGDMVVLGTSARYEGLTSALGRTVVVGGPSARYGGSNSALGRTVVVGGPSADQSELIRHAARAHELAVGKLVCCGQAREVDLASRSYLATAGLAPMYNVGHGIGWTEVFEKGIASQHSTYCFPASIAIQIDVGIVGTAYKSLPADRVGLRLEDPYLIDAAGKTERLTDLPLIGGRPDASRSSE